MYSGYSYVPSPPIRHESRWRFGWTSCLLFMATLLPLVVYALMPGVPLPLVLISIMVIAAVGSICALISIVFGRFWLSKVYATCGLIGNFGVLLWILLSL